jgi:hypothetical protein
LYFLLISIIFLFPKYENKSLHAVPLIKIGKIVYLRGKIDIIDLEKQTHHTGKLEEIIFKTYEIRTGSNSRIDILLRNGEEVNIYSRSVVNIYQEKIGKILKKTVRLLTGQVHIHIPYKLRKNERFIIKTPTSLTGVKGTDLGIIASVNETRIVVFMGRALVGNRSKLIQRTFLLDSKNEIRVFKGKEPEMPRLVSESMLRNWFVTYFINQHGEIKKKVREEDNFFDLLIKKRNIH